MAWILSCFGARNGVRKDKHVVDRERYKKFPRFHRIFGAAKRALGHRNGGRMKANVPSSETHHENVNVNLLGPHYESSAEMSPAASGSSSFAQELRPTQHLQSPLHYARNSMPTDIDTSNASSGYCSLSSPSSPATPKPVPKNTSQPALDYLSIDEGDYSASDTKENFYNDVLLEKGFPDLVVSKEVAVFTPVQNLPDMKPARGDEMVKVPERETGLGSLSASPKIDAMKPTNRSHSFSPDDKPILGMVAAHWPDRNPKAWDGKGIPNLTTKYNEDQAIKWENTPFETKLERALAVHT